MRKYSKSEDQRVVRDTPERVLLKSVRTNSKRIAAALFLERWSQTYKLPPFFYSIPEKVTGEEVIDDLGAKLIKIAFSNMWGKSEDRWFAAEETYRHAGKTPITVVHLKLHQSEPTYTHFRKDNTQENAILRESPVVEASLTVENPILELPMDVVRIAGGTAIHDRVREMLFNFDKQYSLSNDAEYRAFLSRFKDDDSWIVGHNKRPYRGT